MTEHKIGAADFVCVQHVRIHCLAAYAHPLFLFSHKPGPYMRIETLFRNLKVFTALTTSPWLFFSAWIEFSVVIFQFMD